MPKLPELFVGYSALDRDEDCFEYEEDSCYVADSLTAINAYIQGASLPLRRYLMTPVSFEDLQTEFAGTNRFAFEPAAFARMKQFAHERGVSFEIDEDYDEDEQVHFIVMGTLTHEADGR
jgi:hypothetical protein